MQTTLLGSSEIENTLFLFILSIQSNWENVETN